VARLVDGRICLRAEQPRRSRSTLRQAQGRLWRFKLLHWTLFMLGCGTGGIVARLLGAWPG
jgi:hypothetical protein